MMMTEFERGFELGKQSVQPRWISVEERLPERNGDYFAVSESLNDYPIGPKGSVCAGWATFTDGRWEDDMYDSWKVKYWAEPIQYVIPSEFSGRVRIGGI
nr:DUF551 domain-containing protein [Ruminococcus sp.]